LKKHLLEGMRKGALTAEQVELKFNAWKEQKETKLSTEKDNLREAHKKDLKKRFEAETKIKEARALAVASKNSKLAEEAKNQAEAETEVSAEA